MNERRFSRALRNVVRKFRDERERATVGRLNSDGTYTIQVPERPNFVYVNMEGGTLTQALNRGRVALRATLPVKLLRLHDGTLVIDGEDTDLLEDDTGGPDEYGVLPHPLGTHSDVDISGPGVGQALVYDGTNWTNDTVLADVAASIEAAAAKTTPVDADDLGITDSEDSNALKKLSFANLATWIMGKIAALTAKTTPIDADSVVITDSAAADVPKRTTLTNFATWVMAKITALTTKATPVGADAIVITDSAASDVPKRITFTALGTYLNTLYGQLAAANTWVANNAFNSTATSGSAVSVTRNLAAASTDAPVVAIVQDHASDDQMALRVQQDGSGSIAEFFNGATLKAQIKNSGAVVDVKGAARYAGTSSTPPADGTGQALELWYFTGGGGPYGVILAFDRDTSTYKPLRIAGDSIGFEEGATRIMTIDGGNVGIGVNPGLTPLHVKVGTNQNLGVVLSTDTTISAFNDAGSANVPLRILSSLLQIKAGSGSGLATVPGTLHANITTVGNVGGGADDLMTYTIPANVLSTNGQSIWFEAIVLWANNGNTKTITMNYGGTVLGTASGSGANLRFMLRGRIWRTGAATQRAWCEIMSDTGLIFNTYTTPAETLSGTVVIKGVGTSAASATNDVQMVSLTVGWNDVGV